MATSVTTGEHRGSRPGFSPISTETSDFRPSSSRTHPSTSPAVVLPSSAGMRAAYGNAAAVRRLRSSVPAAVMEPAGRPPVPFDGETALGPGHHVVDLALLGGNLAHRVEALPVTQLDGPSGGPVEQAAADPHVLHPVGAVED